MGRQIRGHCPELATGLERSCAVLCLPGQVHRLLYTTNAIEALNAKLRRAVRARGHFPTGEAALKLLFPVLNRLEKEWTMPARKWCMAKAQFAVLFGERFTRAMARTGSSARLLPTALILV